MEPARVPFGEVRVGPHQEIIEQVFAYTQLFVDLREPRTRSLAIERG
jgi:hypothetical protein